MIVKCGETIIAKQEKQFTSEDAEENRAAGKSIQSLPQSSLRPPREGKKK